MSAVMLAYIAYQKAAPPQTEEFEMALTFLPAPTQTLPLVTIQPTIEPTPTPTIIPLSMPGLIPREAYVQIANTGGVGLNLRSEPSRSSSINYLGLESEVFIVRDGPITADDLSWYYLVGFYDDTRNGWAAANYLEIIQNP